jgi:hypothetical protein
VTTVGTVRVAVQVTAEFTFTDWGAQATLNPGPFWATTDGGSRSGPPETMAAAATAAHSARVIVTAADRRAWIAERTFIP